MRHYTLKPFTIFITHSLIQVRVVNGQWVMDIPQITQINTNLNSSNSWADFGV